MKRFIIATLLFIAIALAGIVIDAFFLDSAWEAMPNLVYYALGWLAAGVYVAVSHKGEKK